MTWCGLRTINICMDMELVIHIQSKDTHKISPYYLRVPAKTLTVQHSCVFCSDCLRAPAKRVVNFALMVSVTHKKTQTLEQICCVSALYIDTMCLHAVKMCFGPKLLLDSTFNLLTHFF